MFNDEDDIVVDLLLSTFNNLTTSTLCVGLISEFEYSQTFPNVSSTYFLLDTS